MHKITGDYYIGIDSGGTKCELLITSADLKDKNSIFRKSFEGVHYSVAGPELYSGEVTKFIRQALKEAGLTLKNCAGIAIGIAGAREDKDRTNLKKLFEKKINYKKILVTTDAMTALYGAFEGSEGIILISGTGSVLYGFVNDSITRIGGWGRIIGDEGSGYWIGKTALNFLVRHYDNGTEGSSGLAKNINARFGINKKNLMEKIFNKNFPIQKIAPVVIESAEKNDSEALSIVDKAVEGLKYHITTFLKVSRRKEPLNIAFIGSIIENDNVLSRKLKSEIKKLGIIRVVKKMNSSSYGAVLIAKKASPIVNKL